MDVRVSKRAQAHIDRAAAWWDQHRDLAPEAFDDDLAKGFSLLSSNPPIGAPVPRMRTPGIRRLHLARISYHVYYRIRRDHVEGSFTLAHEQWCRSACLAP